MPTCRTRALNQCVWGESIWLVERRHCRTDAQLPVVKYYIYRLYIIRTQEDIYYPELCVQQIFRDTRALADKQETFIKNMYVACVFGFFFDGVSRFNLNERKAEKRRKIIFVDDQYDVMQIRSIFYFYAIGLRYENHRKKVCNDHKKIIPVHDLYLSFF